MSPTAADWSRGENKDFTGEEINSADELAALIKRPAIKARIKAYR